MKVTVVGCWAPYPAALGACSCYLIEAGQQKILLDIGHGSFGSLSNIIDFRELDGLVVSHFHPDHYMDISCVRHAISGAIRLGSRQHPLAVYAPQEPAEEYQRLEKMKDGLAVVSIDQLAEKRIRMEDCELEFFLTNHPLPNYGTIIYHGGKKVVYSGDSGHCELLVEAAQNADLLICEASLQEKDAAYGEQRGHLTARAAAKIAEEARVGALLITHLWPEYDLAVLHNEAREVFPNTILAKENLALKI